MGKEYLRSSIIAGSQKFGEGLILFDDFEGTLGWTKGGTGGDDTLEHSTAAIYMGTNSLHMKTRVTDAAEDDEVAAIRGIPSTPQGIFLIRCYFMFPDVSDNDQLRFEMDIYDGTRFLKAAFYYYPVTPRVRYRNSAGSMVDIESMAYAPVDGAWNLFRAVVNFKTKKYISVAINNIKHLFDDEDINDFEANTTLRHKITLSLHATASPPAQAYIDNFILREILE